MHRNVIKSPYLSFDNRSQPTRMIGQTPAATKVSMPPEEFSAKILDMACSSGSGENAYDRTSHQGRTL
jgi:hypothetical protein